LFRRSCCGCGCSRTTNARRVLDLGRRYVRVVWVYRRYGGGAGMRG
jgi:hypothetical protein